MTLLITIDGLDWAAFEQALRRRLLPAHEQLLPRCLVGRLVSSVRPGTVASWVSLATGSPPHRHGVTHRLEAWAGGLRPASRQSWQRPAFWEALAIEGVTTSSICFPCACPGADWQGIHVDERILEIGGLAWEDWPLPLDVAPQSVREDLRAARVHPSDLGPDHLAPFLSAGRLNYASMLTELARCSTLFGIIDVLAERASPDFLAVHIDWPRRFRQVLAPATGEPLPDHCWSLLDLAIGRLAQLAGETILIASPGMPGSNGFLIAATEGGQRDLVWADILDVAPTLLAAHGLRDPRLTGRNLLRTSRDLRSVCLNAPERTVRTQEEEDAGRVQSLGYAIPRPPRGWPAPKLLADAETLLDSEPEQAAALLEEALRHDPENRRALALSGLIAFGRRDEPCLERQFAKLSQVAPDSSWTLMLAAGLHILRGEVEQASPLLHRIEAQGDLDSRLRVAGAWLMLGLHSEADRLFQAIVDEQPDCVPALLGLASSPAKPLPEIDRLLRRVLSIDPTHEAARRTLFDVQLQLGREPAG